MAAPRHEIIQEFLLLSVDPEDGTLHMRRDAIPLPENIAPDEHARQHLGWAETEPEDGLLHSTSWRYDDGALILTWAVLPDREPKDTFPVTPGVPVGTTGTRPVRDDITVNRVAAHAARHLAFLLHQDDTVSRVLHQHHRPVHDALTAFSPDVAGTHPTPHSRNTTSIPVGVALSYRSGEAETLLCATGHIAGHPDVCPAGCIPTKSSGMAVSTFPHLNPVRVQEWVDRWTTNPASVPPLQVEDGYLVDGHHRLAAAQRAGITSVPVIYVHGVKEKQHLFHKGVAQDAFTTSG